MSRNWDKYLDNPNIKVVLDNDQWWFTRKESKEPEGFDIEEDSLVGGGGPYGMDLLIHMLDRAGLGSEMV